MFRKDVVVTLGRLHFESTDEGSAEFWLITRNELVIEEEVGVQTDFELTTSVRIPNHRVAGDIPLETDHIFLASAGPEFLGHTLLGEPHVAHRKQEQTSCNREDCNEYQSLDSCVPFGPVSSLDFHLSSP